MTYINDTPRLSYGHDDDIIFWIFQRTVTARHLPAVVDGPRIQNRSPPPPPQPPPPSPPRVLGSAPRSVLPRCDRLLQQLPSRAPRSFRRADARSDTANVAVGGRPTRNGRRARARAYTRATTIRTKTRFVYILSFSTPERDNEHEWMRYRACDRAAVTSDVVRVIAFCRRPSAVRTEIRSAHVVAAV